MLRYIEARNNPTPYILYLSLSSSLSIHPVAAQDPETEAAKGNSAIHFIIYTCTFHVKMSPGLINKISIQ